MTRHLFTATSMAALAWALDGTALAQDASEIEEIIVESKNSQVVLTEDYAGGQVARGGRAGLLGNLDFLDAPFATTAFTSDLVISQQSESIGDVLANDPFVRVAKGFGNFQEVYIIRGFPTFSDDITLNGVYGILPRQFVAAELLERVEVFRGANAFINGAAPGGSASGGTINLVSKRAPTEGILRLTLGFEAEGELYAAADVGQRFGRYDEWGIRVNGVIRDGEGAVENEETNLRVLSFGTDYQGERFRFSADFGFQDNRIDQPRPQVTAFGEVPDTPDADANYAQPFTFSDEQQVFAAVRGEFDITDAITAWVGAGFREGDEENDLANPNTTAEGALNAFRFVNTREDSVRSVDLGLRATFETGAIEHTVVVSGSLVDLEFANAFAFSSFGGFDAGTLTNPIAVSPPATDAFVGGDLDNPLVTEETTTTSFAFADTLAFLDGRLLATLGIRYQNIDTAAFDATSGALLTDYDEGRWTPAFGLVWKPTDALSVYANYAENLQAGDTAPNAVGGQPVLNGGDILNPFVGEQYEIGAKYDAGSFGGTLSLFSVNRPNAFVEDNVFGANGEQRNLGIELSVFGEPLEGFRVLGGLTVLDNELKETAGDVNEGNTAVGLPEFQTNINLEYDIPALPGLTVDGRFIHTGEQFTNAENTISVDSWSRLDIGVRYTTDISGVGAAFRLRLENVTDNSYWATVGGFPGANYLIQGAPRTISFTASADF